MYKIQKNFDVKIGQTGLIGMETEESKIDRHFAIRCIRTPQTVQHLIKGPETNEL